jgi:chlorobactene glucosyltransferase
MMLFYQVGVFLLLVMLAGHFFLNLFFFRKPKKKYLPDGLVEEEVSILIPARNEEGRIRHCLDSLLRQEGVRFEIGVLNDHSTDGTAQVVREYAERDSRVRLWEGEDLPVGWTGKGWACEQLGKKARGQWLLFTDADTVHEPEAVAAALGEARKGRLDLLSLWPRQMTGTWSEILVIPFVHGLLLFFLPHWMPGRFRSLGAANGQFLFFRREVYEKMGGHEKVKGHLVDDVALAREIKVGGWRLGNRDGSDLVSCRMYENVGQLWEGFTKNMRAGFDDSWGAFLFLFGLQLVAFFGPFLWLGFVVRLPEVGVWVGAQILVIGLMRLVLAIKCRQPLLSVLLHPLGQLFVLLIALNSWWRTAQGRVSWKGRMYGGGRRV